MEARIPADYWLRPEEDLTATIANDPKAGMSLNVFTKRRPFFLSSFSPIAFEQHSFVAPSRIGDACQRAAVRFNMYVQLFAGRNFVGIV
jgi:hypothetical protein